MKKALFFFSILVVSLQAEAQRKYLLGKVLDASTQLGVNVATVINQKTKQVTRTNDKGVFFLWASKGDSIIVSSLSHGKAGILWDGLTKEPLILMNQQAIALQEVNIKSKRHEEILKEIEEFRKHPTASKNLTLAQAFEMRNSPISLLYEIFSKEAKSRRRLAVIIQKEQKEDYAKLLFSPSWVSQVTKLKGQELVDFMKFCKFSDDYILEASEYELAFQTLRALQQYQRLNSYFYK